MIQRGLVLYMNDDNLIDGVLVSLLGVAFTLRSTPDRPLYPTTYSESDCGVLQGS
jgi:hypothetical protein